MHIVSTEEYLPTALRQQYLRAATTGRADAKLHNNRVHIAFKRLGESDQAYIHHYGRHIC